MPMKGKMGDRLPVEIIYEILSRMPMKSLDRFRCVSKEWCKYIDDPNLAIIHLNRAAKQEPIMLFIFKERPRDPGLLTLFHITTGDQALAKKHSVLEFECKTPFCADTIYMSRYTIRGSCNGLLYFSYLKGPLTNPQTTLFVIHPLRNQSYELPPCILSMTSCGLGFDASTNTFKMCVSCFDPLSKTMRTMVHVLGIDDSWREITHVPPYVMMGYQAIFAHSCLHWLGFDGTLSPEKIVRFDLTKEEFGIIDLPRKKEDKFWVASKLVDLHGEVGFVYHHSNKSRELWALKENNQWVIQCQIDAKPPVYYSCIDIVGLWNNSGDILVTTDAGAQFFVYSLETRSFRQVNFIGREDNEFRAFIRMYQSSLFIRMYRSSLFTVPGMKKSAFLRSSFSKKRRKLIRVPSKAIHRFFSSCF